MSILAEIFAHKRQIVAERRNLRPLTDLFAAAERARPPLDLVECLTRETGRTAPALIAEVKFASPSKGVLYKAGERSLEGGSQRQSIAAPIAQQSREALRLAEIYRDNGASAISVLTDERYFHGCLEYLEQIAEEYPGLPVLRKDFICDPYQVYETRAAGADALLLIVAGFDPQQLSELYALTIDLGMEALVEVHNMTELQVALKMRPRLVGINNRDLNNFQVDLETSLRLRRYIPEGVCVVSESGIHSREDSLRLHRADIDAMLVGEALVTAPDIGLKVRELLG